MPEKRPSWDEYFIEICKAVRSRATCDRGRNGVVIVKGKQILTTGYVGSPIGMPHCDDVGHIIKETKHEDGRVTKHCLRTTHAEINAITQAAKLGVALDGATLYSLLEPCLHCAKAIVNSGIKRVVCEKRYHDAIEAQEIFQKAGVEHVHLTNEIQVYDNM
jgi:dCMP deaminase